MTAAYFNTLFLFVQVLIFTPGLIFTQFLNVLQIQNLTHFFTFARFGALTQGFVLTHLTFQCFHPPCFHSLSASLNML